MKNIPIWKPLLILAVLAMCGLSLYPPSQRLKPGLDLAGGTTLVYQVEVPSGQNAKTVIDQVIETLKKRVDPNGVRNLVWRHQAGNRIEIQMPLPPAQTNERRTTYLRLQDELLKDNIQERQLDAALRLDPTQHAPTLDRLARGNQQRRELLDALVRANKALTAAQGPYQTAQQQLNDLESAIQQLPDTATSKREQLQSQLKQAQSKLVPKTRAFLDARSEYNQTRQAVLGTNVDPYEIDQALTLPAKADVSTTKSVETREAAIQKLIDKHPGRTDQIKALVKAKTLYNEVRGPFDDPNDLISLLRGSGVLEFRITASLNLPDASRYRKQLTERGPKAATGQAYRWFVIDDVTGFAENTRQREALETDPQTYLASRGLIGQRHGIDYYVLLANTPDKSLTRAQKDWKLTEAYSLPDDSGFPAVGFQLNRVGGQLMGSLTGNNRGEQMAIVLDGRVISAPRINDRIQDSGIITGGRGGFGQDEQSYLIRTLNAGSLQGRLSEDPIYIKKFGPQLGQDNLRHGLYAAVWALVVVAVYMTAYYFLAGMVANFALAANMIIILGVMVIFDATFTLPGIAGIVLTIGMAVDANVLIFERIREELTQKSDIRTAVRIGYDKALSSIVDANVTTLITCVILNYTATAEIKGFAITLMVGILASMFTALFCTRVVIDAYLYFAKPKTITMAPMVINPLRRLLEPAVNWVGMRHVFFSVSALLVAGSLWVVTARGQELLDIEFRSGTQVSFELSKGTTLDLNDVRSRLTQAAQTFELPNLAGDRANVVTVGETEGLRASEFSVATLETNATAVSEAIKSVFADVLDTQRPIAFKGMGTVHEAPLLSQAPVYIVRHATLGENINRRDAREDVSDYVGGVAVVLDGLEPTATIGELTDRISRMRLQPSYEAVAYRPSTVIGLDLDAESSAEGAPKYRSAVVIVSEAGTDYTDNPQALNDEIGLAGTEWRLVRDAMRRDTSLGSVANFSSQISNTMKQQAVVAMTLSLLAVVAYIWIRFGSFRYGLAAIIALVHDVVIALGLLAVGGWVYESAFGQALLLTDFKINLAIVASMLTIVGYSLNDSIIVFDRIRENRGRLDYATPSIVNDSINQTFSRTINTSLTTLMALITLYVFGGDGVHGFAFAMLVGVIVGTYSSVAIAAPIVLMMGGGIPAQPAKKS